MINPSSAVSQPRTLFVALVCLFLAACSCRRTVVTTFGDVTWLQQGDELTISVVREGIRHRAVLEKETGNETVRIYRIESLVPHDEVMTSASLSWLFRHLDSEVTLRTPAGMDIEHPDRAVQAELMVSLRATPPDVTAALKGLPLLLRMESRAAVWGAAWQAAPRGDAEFEELSAAAVGPEAPLLAPAADGEPAGGSTSRALHDCLAAMTKWPDLGTARADRLAQASEQIESSTFQATILDGLVPLASTGAVLGATAQISSSSSRFQVLRSLTQKANLDPADAERIVAVAPTLDSSSYEESLLRDLVPLASTDSILRAAQQISSSSSRHEVLGTLARKQGLSPQEANAIAAASPNLESSSYEEAVLRELIGKASTDVILDATAQISSSSSRYEILAAVAGGSDLSPAAADAIAAATPALESSSYESAVLIALMPHASTDTVLAAAGQISSSSERYKVLRSLADRADLTPAEADAVAAAGPGLESSSYEADLLVALAGRASVKTLLLSADEITSSSERHKVLMALAGKPGIGRADADAIAAATPGLSSSSYQATVLLALIERASRQAVKDAAKQISSSSERIKVLEALVEREK